MPSMSSGPIRSSVRAAHSTQALFAGDAATGTKQKLNAEQLDHARKFLQGRGMPAGHLEQVVFVKGMKGQGWIVETALKNGNPAITRDNAIYVRDDFGPRQRTQRRRHFGQRSSTHLNTSWAILNLNIFLA